VTLRELADINPAKYIELTRSRRPVIASMKAIPSEQAGEVLTQRIRTARSMTRRTTVGSTVDYDRISEYVEKQNDSITVDDLPFVMSDRPCVLAFVERVNPFGHRSASHLMEMFVITHFMRQKVPIEVEYDDQNRPRVVGGTMVEFFSQAPGFDEDYTCGRIEEYISRSYDPVSCEKIWQTAEQFCLGSGCAIFNDTHAQTHQ
jgi:hypothetical protein